MIDCICINDSNKPTQIPKDKWLVKGEKYHVIYTVTVLPQKELAFHLHEIELDETCHPYEYFLANRFAFTQDGLKKLIQLIKNCSDTDFSMEELMEQCDVMV